VDGQYYSSYFDLSVHKLMLDDEPRTEAYRDAILANKEAFQDKVVMDVGAGTGILSLFCMKAGARKVYAVEASEMAGPLKSIVEANGASGVIEVIHGKAEEVDIPEKVDVLVSEWMGFYLLHESMLNSVIAARDRHLSDDGIVLPSHARIVSAACTMDAFNRDNVDYWNSVYGFDMSPLKRIALAREKPEVIVVEAEELLHEPRTVAEFDLRWVGVDELQRVTSRQFVSVERCGVVRAVAVWFECDFKPDCCDEWKFEVNLSTAPGLPDTHWKQTCIILPTKENQDVEKDDVIGWDITLLPSEENRRHYQIQLEILDPAAAEHPMPCRCQMAKCALIEALMKKEEEEAVNM